jgi:hypothetical protein
MMKAQLDHEGAELTLRVCGRVAEGWVGELERCWGTAKKQHPDGSIHVDLRCVTFIDAAGEALLRRMYEQGARFIAAGLLNQQVVNQVTGGSK